MKRKLSGLLVVLYLLFIALSGLCYTGCGSGTTGETSWNADEATAGPTPAPTHTTSPDSPAVHSIKPADGAKNVEPDSVITVAFSREMDASTINTSTVRLEGPIGPVEGKVVYSHHTKIATFSPTIDMLLATGYTLRVTTDVKDKRGISMDREFASAFTVRDGEWKVAHFVSDKVKIISELNVLFNSSRNAMVLWTQKEYTQDEFPDTIMASYYTADNRWGTASRINSIGDKAEDLNATMDTSGKVLLVWNQCLDWDLPSASTWIYSNCYAAGSGWGTEKRIEAESDKPSLAADKPGNALVVWERGEGINANRLRICNYDKNAGWGTIKPFGPDIEDTDNPRAAGDPVGNAIVVWEQWIPSGDDDPPSIGGIAAQRFVVGSGWETQQYISKDENSEYPRVAVSASGNAVAIWTKGYYDGLWSNYYRAGTGWGTEQHIAINNDYPIDCLNHNVVIDPFGNALAIWNINDGKAYTVYANHYTAGSGWGGKNSVSDHIRDAWEQNIVMDSSGNATVVWRQDDGPASIWARRYYRNTGWGEATRISSGQENAYGPEIAVDLSGKAMVVWHQNDGSRNTIWACHFE